MPTFKPNASDTTVKLIDEKPVTLLKAKAYNSFDTNLLGLGDLSTPSKSTESICAIFDLQGFTHFCSQIEPALSVPHFLKSFIDWLMLQIRTEMKKEEHPEGIELWCPLPFYIKFLGDGLLVIWDVSLTNDIAIRNIIVNCADICKKYESIFLKTIKKQVVDPPTVLRCGIARGAVFSVGNGNDFVGSCINMAARLQKLPGLSFAFNRRGIAVEGAIKATFFKEQLITKQVLIRGIGDNELICARKIEFDAMKAKDKKFYRDP